MPTAEGGAATPADLGSLREQDRNRAGRALFRKLKPGPGHSAEEVLADQRRRLERALVELIAARGYAGVTVRGLSRTAGVSTRTFYGHFANVEECFSSTYGSLMRCGLRRSHRQGGSDWEANLRARIGALMDDLAEHPKAAHLTLVESSAAGSEARRQMRPAIRGFERLLANGLADAPDRDPVPLRVVQGMVAGVMRVARARVLAGRGAELPRIAPELSDWVLSLRGAYAVDREKRATLASACPRRRRGEASGPVTTLFDRPGDERARLLAAVTKLSAGDGYRTLSVSRIRIDAGVSRRRFDANFGGVDECLLEAIEALAAAAVERAGRRAAAGGEWEERIYRATLALFAEIAQHSILARLGFVHIFEPGRAGLQLRERIVARGADRLRAVGSAGDCPSELSAEASMAAAWRIAEAEVAAGRARELPKVAPTAAYALMVPVVGASRAARAIGPGGCG